MSSSPTPLSRPTGSAQPAPASGSRVFFRSIAGRLTLWYVVSAFAVVATTIWLLYAALSSTFDEEVDNFLKDTTSMLTSILKEKEGTLEDLKKEVDSELSSRRYARIFVRVLDDKGNTLVEAHQMSHDFPSSMFPLREEDDEGRSGIDAPSKRGRAFRIMSTRVHPSAHADTSYIIQVAYDRKHETGILRSYRQWLWIGLSAALLACAVVGYVIAHRGIRPVQQITEAAGRVQSSTLHQRLVTEGLPSELQSLAGTFNEMLDRLEDSFSRISQFSGDIAHELRTPLSNIRGELEVSMSKPRSIAEYREVIGSALEECDRLTRLVDRLLFIARTESPETKIELELQDIAYELGVVRDFYDPAAADAHVTLTVSAEAKLYARINRELFQSAIGNLIANALRHTPQKGTVSLTARRDGTAVAIAVADTGCGIPPEHLPHVFDRFYRVDGARSAASGGVGLGLALVRSIAKLHDAEVNINSAVGKGTCVTLRFPVADAPAPIRNMEPKPLPSPANA